jgi:hypothetical protein
MPGKIPTLGAIHEKILDLLKRKSPGGLSIYEIRAAIPDMGTQQHLDKRVRELRYYYKVPQRKNRYYFEGERSDPAADRGVISQKLRAAVLQKAHSRCQMCGRTVADDGIKLVLDHKIPRNWGGPTVIDNLWAICELCNGGKRDFFATLDDSEMMQIVKLGSVYERIAKMPRLHKGKPVPSWLLEFVANVNDFQEDWQKRLRELRHPVIGLKIKASRPRTPAGKWEAAYVLEKWKPLPANHRFLIKEYERENRRARRSGGRARHR